VRNNRVIQISRLLFDREMKSTQYVVDALFKAVSSLPQVMRSGCAVRTQSFYAASDGKNDSGATVMIQLYSVPYRPQ